jgi:hypothetical protein
LAPSFLPSSFSLYGRSIKIISDVKLINEVENVKQLTEQTKTKAKIMHKTDQAIKKSGVDPNNIIETKRVRKPTL